MTNTEYPRKNNYMRLFKYDEIKNKNNVFPKLPEDISYYHIKSIL